MTDQPYPIHPTLDKLIQFYKEFSQVPFPRGLPQPVSVWKPVLQPLTRYEAHVVKTAHAYMAGAKVDTEGLECPHELKAAMGHFKFRSSEDDEFFNKLRHYCSGIETLAHLIVDCVDELGSPYKASNLDR